MIFDTAYDPWRLIKVMVNENKGDDPIVNLSWTMDCQRVITITHSVCIRLMYFLSVSCIQLVKGEGGFVGVGDVARHAN